MTKTLPSYYETDLFDHKFIPAKKKSSKLMVVLHGRGDSLKPFRFFDEEIKVSDINYLLLNANRRYLTGFSWYGEPPFQAQGVIKSRQRLFELLSDLEKNGFPSRNIFLLGFSQGALMCSDLGMHYPKKFAGIISVSGYFHFFPKWKSVLTKDALKTPWLFTHGDKDDVLDWQSAWFGVQKLREAGISCDWHLFQKKHVFNEDDYKVIRQFVRERI